MQKDTSGRVGKALPWMLAAAAMGTIAAPAIGLTVNPATRQASQDFYLQNYVMSSTPAINWTGSHNNCDPGTTSAAFKEAVAKRINYFRAMAGIPAEITFNATYNSKAQAAALMMSRNDNLSHDPPTSWLCYSAAGDEAASKSNLYYNRYGWEAITGYIQDPGTGNEAAGHRRWILYPTTQQMGTGDIPPTSYVSANALWIWDDHTFADPRPATREEFVAWPPKGFVPYPVIFGRWSFGFPFANFANATVTMTKGGVNVPVTKEALHNDPPYGDATIVWRPNNMNSDSVWPKPSADETYRVTIGNVVVQNVTRSFTYDVTIFDPAVASTPTLSINDVTVTEGNSGTSNATFTVTLSRAVNQTVTVNYATQNGTATAGSDFTATSGTLSFAANATSRTITVPIVGDTAVENQESFKVLLSSPSGAQISDGEGLGTIADNDTLPTGLSIKDSLTQPEGSAGTPGKATFNVYLQPASAQTVTVQYQTANGIALAGQDYVAKSGTLTFNPGETRKSVVVNFIGDAVAELNETLFLDIRNSSGPAIADSRGSAYLRNDDGPGISIANAPTVDEGNTGTRAQTFRVTLSAASTNTITVNWATVNGTAGPADYTAATGTLTFSPGQTSKTFIVQVKGDTADEVNETYRVNLSRPIYAVLADSQGVAYIRDDDGASPTAPSE